MKQNNLQINELNHGLENKIKNLNNDVVSQKNSNTDLSNQIEKLKADQEIKDNTIQNMKSEIAELKNKISKEVELHNKKLKENNQ